MLLTFYKMQEPVNPRLEIPLALYGLVYINTDWVVS